MYELQTRLAVNDSETNTVLHWEMEPTYFYKPFTSIKSFLYLYMHNEWWMDFMCHWHQYFTLESMVDI